MGFTGDEKRKNDAPRRLRWLVLLAAGFVLGVVLTLAVTSSRNTATVLYTEPPDGLYLTATRIIQDATATALGTQAAGGS